MAMECLSSGKYLGRRDDSYSFVEWIDYEKKIIRVEKYIWTSDDDMNDRIWEDVDWKEKWRDAVRDWETEDSYESWIENLDIRDYLYEVYDTSWNQESRDYVLDLNWGDWYVEPYWTYERKADGNYEGNYTMEHLFDSDAYDEFDMSTKFRAMTELWLAKTPRWEEFDED